jgi:hypothetical protein
MAVALLALRAGPIQAEDFFILLVAGCRLACGNCVDPLDVTNVTQLPELSGGKESPSAFADMVLTQWLRYDRAFLDAEQPWNDLPDFGVSWRVHPKESGIFSREFEAGISPSLASFRASLDYIRHTYIGGDIQFGCVERLLRQGNIVRHCTIYFSMTDQSGFWIRAYGRAA